MTARPLSLPLLLVFVVFAVAGCDEVFQDFFTYHQAGSSTGTGGMGGAGGCTPGAIVACYDGPAGTDGVGLCKPGSKTCAADGASFGPCEGAILPVAENCATPVDENCDGKAPSCKGFPLWSKRAGDASDQHALGVAVDGAGNVLVTGDSAGEMDLGGCPLSSSGSPGLFVAKLDPSGACLWSKGAGDAGSQSGQGVAVDGAGNVIVTGAFKSAMDLGGCPLLNAGGSGLFVAKLDPSGACLWSKSAGANGYSVAVDGAGNVLVTGTFGSSMDFGGCPLSNSGSPGLFVAKLDPSGACLWSKSAGAAEIQSGKGVAADGAGNVLVTGDFLGTMDFGGCPLSKTGLVGLFVAKLDPSGACLWSKDAGEAGGQFGKSVAADGAGNVLVTGDFLGTMDFGGCPLSKVMGSGLFVTKLDSSGACLWSKDAGEAGSQYGQGVAVDNVGNVLVTGIFNGLLSFGGGSIASAGDGDVFLVKLDAAGAYAWVQRGGGASGDMAKGVAVDDAGNVLVTGNFNGSADFGTGPLVSAGAADIFVAKFGP